MGRVKKPRRQATSTAGKPAKPARQGRDPTRRAPRKSAAAPGGRSRTTPARGRKAPAALPPVPSFSVRALDPLAKCGPATSVQQLYRVDEAVDGKARPHLVFLDRHGWYCEHGRDCPAVVVARRVGGGARNGQNINGRMRA